MNIDTCERSVRVFTIAIATITGITLGKTAGAQENVTIGTVQQGLVGGSTVSAADQERYGLLTLNNNCSASLLRNNWAITAAHCVDRPNPSMPGQFIPVAENSVTLTGKWSTEQKRQSMRIISFRPLDVAIIRVDAPFSVSGSTTSYNRDVFRGGDLVSLPILALGRGIYQFAQRVGGSVTPAQRDGQFRLGLFEIQEAADDVYSFSPSLGQSLAGGDSGGPSFTIVGGNVTLVGVHSNGETECLEGQMCGAWAGPGPPPADYSAMTWVSGILRINDVRIAPIWDEIDRYLGAFTPPPPGPAPIRAQGRVRTGTSSSTPLSTCEAARVARERNSPAAPGLEAKCAAEGTVKAQGRVKLEAGTTPNPTRSICEMAKLARARNSPAAPGLEAKCAAERATEVSSVTATGTEMRVFQPENTIQVRVQYRKELGYKGDTGAFGYLGPTSCDAFSINVAPGDGSRPRDPYRIATDSKMAETGDYYVCNYLVSFIPLDQAMTVSVSMSGINSSAPWNGGGEAQPPVGQQRTILDATRNAMLTAVQPRARLSYEMVYAPVAQR